MGFFDTMMAFLLSLLLGLGVQTASSFAPSRASVGCDCRTSHGIISLIIAS